MMRHQTVEGLVIGELAYVRACARAGVCVEGSDHGLILIITSEFTGLTGRRRTNILSG
jgi:hypothetical protein